MISNNKKGNNIFLKPFLFLFSFCFVQVTAYALEAVVNKKIFYMPAEANAAGLQPYGEFYWQLNPAKVSFKNEGSGWKAKIKTVITIMNDTGMVINERYVLESNEVADFEETPFVSIIDLKRYVLPPGNCKLILQFTDINKESTKPFVFIDSFLVAPDTNSAFFSSLQIIDTFIQNDKPGIFERNGRQQVPLCTDFIDDGRKSIGYYTELYHADVIAQDQYPLTKRIFISKKELDIAMQKLVQYDTVYKEAIQFASGRFSTAALPSGNYYLNIVLQNKNRENICHQTLFFQVINSKPEQSPTESTDSSATKESNYLNLNSTFVAKYKPEQIRAILKMLLPVSTPAEYNVINNFLKNPDDMYSRYFVYNFWLNRNKENPEREWNRYTERVKEVNKLFKTGRKPGYETDRGIAYLKYGKPDERIIVKQEQGSLPYEIWQYNVIEKLGSNHVFLFYQAGFTTADFELLHCTVNGERRNRQWRQNLYINGNNPDARVEQYLSNR